MTSEQSQLPKLYITRNRKPPLASYHLWMDIDLTTTPIFTEHFRAILDSNKYEVFNYLNPDDVVKSGIISDSTILANYPYQSTDYEKVVLGDNDVFIYLDGSRRGCPIWYAVSLYESEVYETISRIIPHAPKLYIKEMSTPANKQ